MRTNTQLPEAPMSTTNTRTARKDRKTPIRPETAAAEAALAANTAEVRPAVTGAR